MIEIQKTEQATLLEPFLNVSFFPERADTGANGFDLRACIDSKIELNPGETFKFPTGVRIWIKDGNPFEEREIVSGAKIKFCGLLLPRSSNPGLTLTNTVGLLDLSYQGEIFFKYANRSDNIISIQPGERIGQIIFVPTFIGELKLVESFDGATERGSNGFGSTGKI